MEKKIAKELESKGGEVRVFSYMLVIFSLIVIFFGTVFVVGRKNFFKDKKQQTVSSISSDDDLVEDNIYEISSNFANVQGIAKINKENSDKLRVEYLIHITQNLPKNKKCFNNGNDEERCRWIDFYNYVASISKTKDVNNKKVVSGRLYPVFCSSFSELKTDGKKLYDVYNSCWQGKEKVQYKKTDKYFIRIIAFYSTIEEFLDNKIIKIIDAKDYTERSSIKNDKMTTIVEKINEEEAVKTGKIIKTLEIDIKR